MKRKWRNVLVFTLFAVSVATIVLILIFNSPDPPAYKVELARKAISRAGRNKADTYSIKLLSEAMNLYDSAMVNWEKQNRRFIIFRNYDKVAMFAQESARKADQATDNSVTTSKSLQVKIKQKIESLNVLIGEIDTLFNTYPLNSVIRNRISRGKLMLKEAEVLYHDGRYYQANRKVTDSEYLLTGSYEHASNALKDYFKSYSVWKGWIDKAISDSRKSRSYSIIIDKFSRKCLIYRDGIMKYEFNTELSSNWVGTKRAKGDRATPEGMYKITRKFERGKTKYYKALLLDYPNDEDKKRFKSEIESGTLPSSSEIGGLIEIHGEGGKGMDWTDGCIALSDKEMDIVYRIAKAGTPVTIVGSIVELQRILNK
jgi:hypothetical protein